MKKDYNTPVVEKLEFNYKAMMVTSGIHGDYGNGNGCGRTVTYHGKGC